MNSRRELGHLWELAIHEAGHAAAGLALGLPLHSVSVLADELGQSGGRVFWDVRPRADLWRHLVAILAGAEAQAAAGQAAPYSLAADDLGRALGLLVRDALAEGAPAGPLGGYVAGALGPLEAARQEAAELVRVFWPEISAGALALATAGTMSGAAFAAAAGGRLALLAGAAEQPLEQEEQPLEAAEFLPVAECAACGWRLTLPAAAFHALDGRALDLWVSWQRPRLCREHGGHDDH